MVVDRAEKNKQREQEKQEKLQMEVKAKLSSRELWKAAAQSVLKSLR